MKGSAFVLIGEYIVSDKTYSQLADENLTPTTKNIMPVIIPKKRVLVETPKCVNHVLYTS